MDGPKVSVIIPNYNHAQYLVKRIESVIYQTYGNIEVIILDDCSSDRSMDVIEIYRSNSLIKHVVYNALNSGSPFLQWKKGIELAQGDWIWIAESDDYAEANFLEVLISSIGNKENIGLAYCDSHVVSKDDVVKFETFKNIKNSRYKSNRWDQDYCNSGVNELRNWFLPHGTINNTSAVLFNKNYLLSVNPFDLDLRLIGDKYFFMKILSCSNLVYVSSPLNYYRDPFNTKYLRLTEELFKEHFLISNWFYKTKILDRYDFFEYFLSSSRVSMFKNWSFRKIKMLLKLSKVNFKFVCLAILYNLTYPVVSKFKNAILK